MTVTLRLAAPGLLLALAILLPFLDKPFTIDDTLFLRMAEQALDDPLHPTAFEYIWHIERERVSTIMPSGPVGAWLLLPAVALDGAEWAGHGIQFFLLLLAVLATVSLARQLGLGSAACRWSGLFLAASPAVLGMAGTCMPDIPAMAFGVLGIERLVAWFRPSRDDEAPERKASTTLVAGVIALSLAMLARSHALLLVGVVALLALGLLRSTPQDGPARRSARRRLAGALCAVIAAPLLARSVLMLTRDPLANTGVEDAIGGFFGFHELPLNLFSFVTHFVFVLPLAVPLWLNDRRRAGAGGWILGTLLGVRALDVSRRLREWWPLAPLTGLAFAVLWSIVRNAWERRHDPFEQPRQVGQPRRPALAGRVRVALVAWLFVAAPVSVYLQLPSKYLLLSAPAVALLLSDALGSRRLRYGVLAYGAILGILILRADANLAAAQRQAVELQIVPRIAQGERVWIAGHWGFQWYAERAGATSIWSGADPRPGEFVVVDPLSSGREQLEAALSEERRTLYELVPLGHPGGRVMSGGAGFFSNSWGLLPWSWSSEPIAKFEVWQIKKKSTN